MACKTYIAIASRDHNEAAYSITFPAFPGVTSVAETLGTLSSQAHDALATAIEDMQADGEALPPAIEDGASDPVLSSTLQNPVLVMVPIEVQARSVRVNISLNEGLLTRLDALADVSGKTRSGLLAQGVRLVLAGSSRGNR